MKYQFTKELVIILLVLFFTCRISAAETQTVDFCYHDILDYVNKYNGNEKYSSDGLYVYKLLDDNTAILEFYLGNETTIYIPETIDGYPVSEINFDCFESSYEKYDRIVIPGSIKRIQQGAFSCTVDTIEIQEGVQEIVGGAFTECTVKRINIPDSASLSPSVNGEITPFIECLRLEEILVSESHPELLVSDHVLFNKDRSILIYYPTGLTADSYTVPDGVIEIGKFAFFYEKDLKSITFPSGLKRIGRWAFAECSIENVVLPNSVEAIEARAFLENRDISHLVLSENLGEIGREAFYDSELGDVYLPSGLWYLGKRVFDEEVVLHVIRDSYAYFYAIENGYQFVVEQGP